MRNIIKSTLFITLAFQSIQVLGQISFRENLQTKLDSIIEPYEKETDTYFGTDMTFAFKQPYTATMKKNGSLYTAEINSIKYNRGDTIKLVKVNVLTRPYILGKLSESEQLVVLSRDEINKSLSLKDSLKFWHQFDKFKKVKARNFAQYWLALMRDEKDDYLPKETNERIFMNLKANFINIYLSKKEGQTTMRFDLSSSAGEDLKGLGCADTKNEFVEFKFSDGSVLKKENLDSEYCQSLKIDISDHLAQFKNPISALKLGLTKKTKNL